MAKGSHATWGTNDSRICFDCGKKIALVRGAKIYYDAESKRHRSAHLECATPIWRVNAGHEGNTYWTRMPQP